MSLRAIIVDDEPAARELLEELLVAVPAVSIIGSYGDPRVAIEAILRDKPDVLFLDVQMPILNGFEVLEALDESLPAAVVFVSAYDQHAIDAFDVSAADYVLKPVDGDRLLRAVERAVRRAAEEGPAPVDRTRAVMTVARERSGPARVIPIGGRDRIILQRVDEVLWFEAQGKYIRVHTASGTHQIRLTMQSLENRLDPDRFLRVSRSAIVNIDQIKQVEPWSHGDYLITLRLGAQVYTTPGYRARLHRLIRLS